MGKEAVQFGAQARQVFGRLFADMGKPGELVQVDADAPQLVEQIRREGAMLADNDPSGEDLHAVNTTGGVRGRGEGVGGVKGGLEYIRRGRRGIVRLCAVERARVGPERVPGELDETQDRGWEEEKKEEEDWGREWGGRPAMTRRRRHRRNRRMRWRWRHCKEGEGK